MALDRRKCRRHGHIVGSEQLQSIADYLPQSDDGLIVFTTRTQEAAVALAGGDVVQLGAMSRQLRWNLSRSR